MPSSVKSLEWPDPSKPDKSCSYDHVRAETMVGTYLITWKSWKFEAGYVVELGNEFVTTGCDLNNAKEKAQADFNKRIGG